MELTDEHFCGIIFQKFRCGLSKQEYFYELNFLNNDEAAPYSSVKRWHNKFNRDLYLIQDEFRSGRKKNLIL